MNTLNINSQCKNTPAFQGSINFSKAANEMLYKRLNSLPEKTRLNALNKYDTFLKKAYESDFDVKVSASNKNKEMYAAILRNGELLTTTSSKQTLLDRIGLTNPIKFLCSALKKAQNF